MLKFKSMLSLVLGLGFMNMGVVPDSGGGAVDANAVPVDTQAQGVVGQVVSAVESALADKVKEYFSSKDPIHLSEALVPMAEAIDDIKKQKTAVDINSVTASAVSDAVAPLQAQIATQAQSISDLAAQVSTLTQKVAQATS